MDQRENTFITNRIKVYGMVQGVGFRPHVYHIAKKYNIKGNVKNVGGYVEILAQASAPALEQFLRSLREDSGSGCEIVKLEIENISKAPAVSKASGILKAPGMPEAPDLPKALDGPSEEVYDDFVILQSEHGDRVSILPPDLSVCPNCQRELYDAEDRRFGNPFISCAACGPRYTIIEELPYDRENTTMADFEMCEACHEEYTSSQSRRYHAQTVSCNDCGPYLILRENIGENPAAQKNRETDRNVNNGYRLEEPPYTAFGVDRKQMNLTALDRASAIISDGGILAVKGIGGYHFVCSPFMEETVVHLRKLKGKGSKALCSNV